MNVLWTVGELVSAYAHINSLGWRREANAPLSLARRLMELLISCLDKTFSPSLRPRRCTRNALFQPSLELAEQIGKNIYRKEWAHRIRQTEWATLKLWICKWIDLSARNLRFWRRSSIPIKQTQFDSIVQTESAASIVSYNLCKRSLRFLHCWRRRHTTEDNSTVEWNSIYLFILLSSMTKLLKRFIPSETSVSGKMEIATQNPDAPRMEW